jgi:hypothetical protein
MIPMKKIFTIIPALAVSAMPLSLSPFKNTIAIATASKIKNTRMFTSRDFFSSLCQPSFRERKIAGIPPMISPVNAQEVANGKFASSHGMI